MMQLRAGQQREGQTTHRPCPQSLANRRVATQTRCRLLDNVEPEQADTSQVTEGRRGAGGERACDETSKQASKQAESNEPAKGCSFLPLVRRSISHRRNSLRMTSIEFGCLVLSQIIYNRTIDVIHMPWTPGNSDRSSLQAHQLLPCHNTNPPSSVFRPATATLYRYNSANAECLIQLDCTRGGGGGGLVGGGDWAPRSRRRLLLKEAVFLRAAPDQGRETPLTRPCISCTATLPAWACFHTLEVSSICPCSAWASWTRKFMRSMCALYNTRSCMLSAAAVSAPAVTG